MADLSELNVNNTDYNLKDASARNDIQSTQVVSGNPITLTDAAPINAESLVVELEPKQDLHGQSAPYVGGAGKNKCPIDLQNGNTGTGMSWTIKTDADGNKIGIVLNGTHVDSSRYFATVASIYLESGNYYLSGAYNDNAALELIGDGVDIYNNNAENPTAFTISTSGTYTLYLAINTNVALSNAELKPMIRLSTETDPTFAPWSNICPITGYTECEVDDVGKNLLNPSTVTLQRYLQSDGSVGIDGGSDWSYTDYIEIEAGEIYTLSGVSNMGTVAKHCFYDENKNFISSINTTEYIFTTPANAKFVRLSNRTLNYSGVMLEKGNQATTYEPYRSSNATIQFGQTVMGGNVNVTDGGTDDERNKVTIGDLNWYYDSNMQLFHCDISGMLLGADGGEIVCSGYKYNNAANNLQDIADGEIWNKYWGESSKNVCIKNTNYSNATDFVNANSSVEICYVKETATIIDTPPTDLKLLKGTNNITTNGTTIHLGYQPDNVIGHTLEVAENYTDKAVGKNILPMTLAGIKAANPHLTWTDETSFTSGNVTVTFQVAGGDIYGIHIVSTGSNGEFFNLCPEGLDYSRFGGCILSGCDVGDDSKIFIAVRDFSNYTYYAKHTSGETVIDDIPTGQRVNIYVYFPAGGTVDTIIRPMIRKGGNNTYTPPKPSTETLMDLIAYLFTKV